jgi:hypothetical protein
VSRFNYTLVQMDRAELEAAIRSLDDDYSPDRAVLEKLRERLRLNLQHAEEMDALMDDQNRRAWNAYMEGQL